MVALESLDPIKNAIGSQDEGLLAALATALGDDKEFQSYARAMIMGSRTEHEPGCWNYMVEPLAEHLGLSPVRLPLEGWKHYSVWKDYRSIAGAFVTPEAQQLLGYMESGRPFHGSKIDHDGCMFAWLNPDEAESLLGELSGINAEEFRVLDGLHEELLESLDASVTKKNAVFLGAH